MKVKDLKAAVDLLAAQPDLADVEIKDIVFREYWFEVHGQSFDYSFPRPDKHRGFDGRTAKLERRTWEDIDFLAALEGREDG